MDLGMEPGFTHSNIECEHLRDLTAGQHVCPTHTFWSWSDQVLGFFFSGCDGSELEKEEKLVFLKLGCCHFNLL